MSEMLALAHDINELILLMGSSWPAQASKKWGGNPRMGPFYAHCIRAISSHWPMENAVGCRTRLPRGLCSFESARWLMSEMLELARDINELPLLMSFSWPIPASKKWGANLRMGLFYAQLH